MEILKFFYERKIFTGQLKEVLTYCSFEDMKYILDNYISFNPKAFLYIFRHKSPKVKPELVEYILKTYEFDVEGKKGFDLMRFAFNKGHIELIKYLLDKDVMLYRDNEEEDETNLFYGINRFYNVMDEATHTNIEAYKLILDKGGKANAKGEGIKNSLLDYHILKGNFEIVKILVEHRALISINTFCRCKDDRTLYYLIDHAIEKLLGKNRGVLINNDTRPSGFIYYFMSHPIENISLDEMLYYLSKALRVKNESVCIYILNNINITGKEDQKSFPGCIDSWLLNAIDMNSSECLRLLLDVLEKSQLIEGYFTPKDIERDEFNSISTPDYYLHAAKMNNQEIVKILIEHKVPINHTFHDCMNNALFWAAYQKNVEIINLLLKYGYEKLNLQEYEVSTFHIHPDFLQLINK